MNDLDSEFKH